MAEVIHTIKGNEYLYEHTREGEKVVCEYIGPVGKGGKVRKAQHGGGAPLKVTQQTGIQKNEGDIGAGKTTEIGTEITVEGHIMSVDMTRLMKDVYARNEPLSTKMVEKRLAAGRPDRALKMAYAGLTKGDNGLPKESYLDFARKYEVK